MCLARLPFKPVHAVQCATDVVPKKRKLIDSNANIQRAKNLKKDAEKLVEIINNNDSVSIHLNFEYSLSAITFLVSRCVIAYIIIY